jgi:hypothetical protein
VTQREIADLLARLTRRFAHAYPARKLREDACLTLAAVGLMTGAAPGSVSRWETGAGFPRSAAGVRWALLIRRLAAEAQLRECAADSEVA